MRQRMTTWWVNHILRESRNQIWLAPFFLACAILWVVLTITQINGDPTRAWLSLIVVVLSLAAALISFERYALSQVIREQRRQIEEFEQQLTSDR